MIIPVLIIVYHHFFGGAPSSDTWDLFICLASNYCSWGELGGHPEQEHTMTSGHTQIKVY